MKLMILVSGFDKRLLPLIKETNNLWIVEGTH